MSIAADLLKADHVGIRDLKENLSKILKKKNPLIVTDRGTPAHVILPYSEMLELLDIIDEIEDRDTLKTVTEGRKAVKAGAKGKPAANLFGKIRANRK